MEFKVAIMSDLHIGIPAQQDHLPKRNLPDRTTYIRRSFAEIAEQNPDAIVLGGDMTHKGSLEQAQVLVQLIQHEILSRLPAVPLLMVLGNHDHWSSITGEYVNYIQKNLGEHVQFLDGTVATIEKDGQTLCIGGVEGYVDEQDTEEEMHDYYDTHAPSGQTLTDVAVAKTHHMLSQLHGDANIVVSHYGVGVDATLEGERKDLYSKLGSARFAELFDAHNAHNPYQIEAAFHGHADSGSIQVGYTPGGIPVRNDSMQTLSRYDETQDHPYIIYTRRIG